MKFIRLFWGNIDRYKSQIEKSLSDRLDEKVFVWGIKNFNIIKEIGYDCELISEYQYDYSISNNHTFYSYKNLNHKIKGIEFAMNFYEEIIFLDWDCKKIKNIDDDFFKMLHTGSELQVPLYVYHRDAMDYLIKNTTKDMLEFFIKLKEGINKYSFIYNGNFIIPNTGFLYCRNKNLISKLWEISINNNLECIPDEFSVYLLNKNYTVEDYIRDMEPKVIGKKEHGYDWWNKEEDDLLDIKNSIIKKSIYFIHN